MTADKALDVLDFIDQAAAVSTLATERNALCQAVWVYDDGVDPVGLERFRQALTQGLLGRRIAASKLPFARDRWVATTAAAQISVARDARPREQIQAWVAERASVPINPWTGPGWHLAVLPLTDGGAAVTLVVSHVLADGRGLATVIAEAALGQTRALPYPREVAPVGQSLRRDAASTAREFPAVARVAADCVRMSRERLLSGSEGGSPAPQQRTGAERQALKQFAAAPLAARAAELGGNESTVLFGVAAAIAAAVGWVRPSDGAAILGLSVDRRVEGDLRGNAMSDTEVVVDPSAGALGVPALRTAIRQALAGLTDEGRYDAFGPLLPLLPRKAVAALVDAPGDPAHPVTTCAALGRLPMPVRSPDGREASQTWYQLAWSALPGKVLRPRPPYLYVGWTGTEREISIYAATNLAAAADLPTVLDAALAEFLTDSRV